MFLILIQFGKGHTFGIRFQTCQTFCVFVLQYNTITYWTDGTTKDYHIILLIYNIMLFIFHASVCFMV